MTEKELKLIVKEVLVEEGAIGDYVKGKVADVADQSIGEVGRHINRSIERKISKAATKVVKHKSFTAMAQQMLDGITATETPFLGMRGTYTALAQTLTNSNTEKVPTLLYS